MASSPDPFRFCKWPTLSAPVVAPVVTPPPLSAAPLHPPLTPSQPPPAPSQPLPATSSQGAQSVAQFPSDAATKKQGHKKRRKQDPEDLIIWSTDGSEDSCSTSSTEEGEEAVFSRIEVQEGEDADLSRLEFKWDEEPNIWDCSGPKSEDEEFSEDQVAEDSNSEVSTPAKGPHPIKASVVAPKDRFPFITRKFPSCAANDMILKQWKAKPVFNKPPEGLESSRWATPAASKPVPKPNTAVPRQTPVAHGLATQLPLPPLLSVRPTQPATTRPKNPSRGQLMLLPRTPDAAGFGSCDPIPAKQTAAVVAAQKKPPSLLLKGPTAYNHASSILPQAPKIAPMSSPVQHVTATMYSGPTYLDYPIAPGVSSLIAETIKHCDRWVQPRTAKIELDDDEHPEHDFDKSEALTGKEKAARNKELANHAKMLKRNLTNTKVGIETRLSKLEMTVNQQRGRILCLIKINAAVVIAAATGSGKTTQLPQIILEDAIESGAGVDCNIWVTQPRRVAATSVARRVMKERFDGSVASVGYHVRFDVQLPKQGGCITYCTTGILLNRIQGSPNEVFDNVSHIIIDEAHERDMPIDRILALLKFHLFARKKAGLKFPKIIVSSATLDIGLFTGYFAQPVLKNGVRELVPCPFLDIPGRMFPVEYTYLDEILLQLRKYPAASQFFMDQDKSTKDYLSVNKQKRTRHGQLRPLDPQTDTDEAIIPAALIAMTIAHIVHTTTEGAILVFLPGLDSIKNVKEKLGINSPMMDVDFSDKDRFRILILHSDMKDLNDEAFVTMPKGVRKIVLATNIAETSITIPDVVYVIDSGKHKEMVYEPERGLSQLRCGWTSQSSCKQRAGRSGRIRNGFYYAMYSKQRFDNMRPTTQPEILRSDLQEICIQLANQRLDSSIGQFLQSLIEPPDNKAVDASFAALKEIGALTDDERITSLGRVLASLPVHPARAKMIVLGIIFRCLDPMLILAAASSVKDMFRRPLEKRQQSKACRMRFSAESKSDHLALINLFDQARAYSERTDARRGRKFLETNFVEFNLWREIFRTAELMEGILILQRLVPWHVPGGAYWKFGSSEQNSNSQNEALVKALIFAGFHPNVAASHGGHMLRSIHADTIIMGTGSVNQDMMKLAQRGQLYTFTDIVKTAAGNVWTMRDNSVISPLSVITFARKIERIGNRSLRVDGWLQFMLPSENNVIDLIHFKNIVDNVLADAYTQLGGSQKEVAVDPLREKLLRTIGQCLLQDTKAYEQWLVNQPKGSKYKRKYRGPRSNRGGARKGGRG